MNLPKAIELGKDAESSLRSHKFIEHADAIKILGEAGEQLLAIRQAHPEFRTFQLPCETEE